VNWPRATVRVHTTSEEKIVNNDDRDYYRMKRSDQLLEIAREQGVTAEMAVVLAERLHDASARVDRGHGQYQPRSTK